MKFEFKNSFLNALRDLDRINLEARNMSEELIEIMNNFDVMRDLENNQINGDRIWISYLEEDFWQAEKTMSVKDDSFHNRGTNKKETRITFKDLTIKIYFKWTTIDLIEFIYIEVSDNEDVKSFSISPVEANMTNSEPPSLYQYKLINMCNQIEEEIIKYSWGDLFNKLVLIEKDYNTDEFLFYKLDKDCFQQVKIRGDIFHFGTMWRYSYKNMNQNS